MCGIAGIFSPRPIGEEHVRAMARAQAHRGPDGEGYHADFDGRLHFGHRRLSIIDLDSGRQPLSDASGRATITFNGEIYNYRELRSELEASGIRFTTQSDTEVLLNAYLVWGKECLNRLRGMFAFAIWDRDDQSLFMARDQVGIKPIHYSIVDGALLFSSELKGITAYPGHRRRIDRTALGLYLRLGYIPAPYTIYQNCFKLRPGHYIVARLEGETVAMREERYWDFQFEPERAPMDEGECLAKVEEALGESVRYHMVSDVPIGFFLSGGIDSSLVSWFGARQSPVPVNTFSMGFDDPAYDELPFAREVAEKIGSHHHVEVLRSESIESTLDRLVGMFDEPFADSSALPTYYVCKSLSGKVKVALSGDGGDEVWGGYKRYLQVLQYQTKLARKGPATLMRIYTTLGKINPLNVKREAIRYHAQTPVERYVYSMHLFFKEGAIGELLSDKLNVPVPDYLNGLLRGRLSHDILDTAQRLDILSYLPEDNLTKVDRTSMANSLEVRVPLLDVEMLKLAARVPARLRVKPAGRNGDSAYSEQSLKYPLRRLTEKHLGAGIAYRNKKGFSVPLRSWFMERSVNDLLRSRMHAISGSGELFNTSYVEGLISEHVAGEKNHQSRLWALLVLFTWWGAMEPEL